MPRKGNVKVRSGCLTCKVRKVKCDERKPSCERCTSTGRKCEGYLAPNQKSHLPSFTEDAFMPINHTFPSKNNTVQSRALKYFCELVGPSISGSRDRYFWNTLVMQFATYEPAVRHAIVTISLLYEQLPSTPSRLGNLRAPIQLQHQQLILTHYNDAIKLVRSMTAADQLPLVLLLCILFVGIEMLQSNPRLAIQHCKHGIEMLANCDEYQWITQYVRPVFRRLSLFPFFFGSGEADYPQLGPLCSSITQAFNTMTDAQLMMDSIYSRTIRLMRLGDTYRFGEMKNKPLTRDLLDEQKDLIGLLCIWHSTFFKFERSVSTTDTLEETHSQSVCRRLLLVRHDKCYIAVNMVFEPDEMEYDKYLGRFKRIQDILVSVASDMPTQTLTSGNSSSKFTMEMAWVPIVSFCTLKCRDLGIRLKMWNTLPILGTSRESLWELSLMIPILKHVIEMEHGLPQGQIDGLEDTGLTDLPPGSLRIKHMWIQSKLTRLMIGEQLRLGRFVGFLLPGDDGEVHSLTEFLDETEYIPG